MTSVGLLALVVAAIVVVALILSFTLRRHGESDRPEPGWRATDEVFRDPSTERVMRVWVDPEDGSRHYVPERTGGDAAPAGVGLSPLRPPPPRRWPA